MYTNKIIPTFKAISVRKLTISGKDFSHNLQGKLASTNE